MDTRQNQAHRHCMGITRRELLQVGYSGLLGVGLSSVLTRRVAAGASEPTAGTTGPQPKSILIVFLTGAASHHDTFDMKPEAPAEVRGEFQPIATSTPGLHICEHLPQLAARADKYAVLRTLSHGDNNHLMSTHYVLTGELQPGGFFDKIASRDDLPCTGFRAGCRSPRPLPAADSLKPRRGDSAALHRCRGIAPRRPRPFSHGFRLRAR